MTHRGNAGTSHPRQDSNIGPEYNSLFVDLFDSVRMAEAWLVLGWHDIKQRYRRSVIGPFWITIATLIFLSIVTLIYSTLLRQNLRVFLPFTATGLVAWGLISACLIDGSRLFIDQSVAIKQLPLPLPFHVLRMIWQQLVIMLHNAAVIILIMVVVRHPVNWNALLALPAIVVMIINLCWISILFAIIGVRFRDVPIIVNSVVPILFLITPIFWSPGMLPVSQCGR